MITSLPYFGETVALLTAVIWAFAVILFRKSGETVHPIALNLFKNVLGLVLFLPTIWIFGETLFRRVPASDYWLLIISGALGIGISDTLFFMCLNRLGAGLTAIVDCLYSPFIIGLSMVWLAERMTVVQVVGVLMIISAVLTAAHSGSRGAINGRDLIWGITWGVLAMATMAVGIVMIKPLLTRSPLLWVTEIRLAAGVIVLLVILAFHPGRKIIVSSVISTRGIGFTITGSFLGTYLALILWLAGMKYTQASIAAALNQTSNIFVFIFAAVFLKEAINLQRTIGIMLGVSGAFMVLFG